MSELFASRIFDVSREVILVSGSSSGLGRRFATVLAANGARVGLLGRRQDELEQLRTEIIEAGGHAAISAFDLTDRDALEAAVEDLEADLGPATVLVNNAGIAGDGTAMQISDEKWHEVFAVDLDAAFFASRRIAPRMAMRGGGAIVNVASILGLRPATGKAAYSVAKAALVQLSGVMALELAPLGIRVNTLAPGYTVTGMNRDYFSTPASRVITDRIPLGRVGQVNDFDGIILLLCSSASRFITGATFVVDGGHVLTL